MSLDTTPCSLDPREWKPSWAPDKTAKECQKCNTPFSFLIRRHHCRRCGSCVCEKCASDFVGKLRVCTTCFVEHSSSLQLESKRQSAWQDHPHRAHYRKPQAYWLIDNNLVDAQLKDLPLEMVKMSYDVIENILVNNTSFVDKLVDTLNAPSSILFFTCNISLDQPIDRLSLLYLLHEILEHNLGYQQFNNTSPIDQNKTRLSRIHTLLLPQNDELSPVLDILNLLNFKSLLFEKILSGLKMRYTIVLDKSASMDTHDGGYHKSRWHAAKDAIEHITEQVERLVNSDFGMDLWLFSDPPHKKITRLRTAYDVEHAFTGIKASGGTDLSGVLKQVFKDHFKHGQPEHILIITDGEPNDPDSAIAELCDLIEKLNDSNELGITFMQVGKDDSVQKFLSNLPQDLEQRGVKMDIVECLTINDYEENQMLCEVLQKHLPCTHPGWMSK